MWLWTEFKWWPNWLWYQKSLNVGFCQILFNIFQFCPILSDFVKFGPVLSDFIRLYLILFNFVHFVQLCLVLSSFVWSCVISSNFVWLSPFLSVFVQSCLILYMFVRLCQIVSDLLNPIWSNWYKDIVKSATLKQYFGRIETQSMHKTEERVESSVLKSPEKWQNSNYASSEKKGLFSILRSHQQKFLSATSFSVFFFFSLLSFDPFNFLQL